MSYKFTFFFEICTGISSIASILFLPLYRTYCPFLVI